ncbi:MAG: sigma-70 family RNA polymerase sigma factor [Actinobacteria bacterium]|nr:sigma-70 family RNA polymerase sigma factor [Actinomycetota bacterium]
MQNVVVDRPPVRLRRPARLLRLASDERLVALVRSGDEGAFEALYDRHHPPLLGFCRHMLGTREEAEDAVQHTFLAAFRDLVRSDKQIDLRPWLFAIARNRCLSMLRARRPHVAIEAAEPATDGLAATVEQREDLRELLADLASLPEEQRAALLLAELGALDHAGIASVLGCPREKVKALVFQARTSLVASREARATPCEQIRLELASASGAALRRGALRRHLRACEGCRAFKVEVATQRKLLALALPVVPSVALKGSVLGGSGASAAAGGGVAASGGAAAGAASAAASAGNGALGGLLGTVASTGAGKLAVSLAVAGVVAGGGALTAELAHRHALSAPRPAPPHAGTAPGVSSAPGARATAAPTGGTHALPATAARPHSRRAADRPATVGAGGPSTTGPSRSASGLAHAPSPALSAPPVRSGRAGGRSGSTPAPQRPAPARGGGADAPPQSPDARGTQQGSSSAGAGGQGAPAPRVATPPADGGAGSSGSARGSSGASHAHGG